MSKLLDKAALLALTTLSWSTIQRLEREGRFPRRIVLANRILRWPEEEVEAWIRQQIEGRNGGKSGPTL